jgi:hypothetical protein
MVESWWEVHVGDGRWIEALEERRFLSGCPSGAAELADVAAAALVAPKRVRFNVNQLLGNYAGTVKLTKPAGLRPYKFNVAITGINVATKVVQGSVSLPKLHFSNIPFTTKSSFDPVTKQFIIRIVSVGTPQAQTLSVTLKGTVTAANLVSKQLTGRFSGYAPFNAQPRVAVDGTFTVTKV